MSATAAVPVLRGEMFDLRDGNGAQEVIVWASGPLLRSTGLAGDDRGVLLAAELVRDRQIIEYGEHAALVNSRFGPVFALRIGPEVWRLMLADEAPTYLAGNGAVAIDRLTRIDLEKWSARRAARRAQA